MKASSTSPEGPSTGLENPRCFAKELADCSPDISREHYISRSLLEAIGEPEVAGLSFQEPDTLKTVGIGSLVAKMLCQRHNESLSPLDAEIARLYKTLRDFDAGLRDSQTPTSEEVEVNGADIERWMLKALVGLIQAGVVKSSTLGEHNPWLEILFGRQEWPRGWGLHVVLSGPPTHAFSGIEIELMTAEDVVLAATFNIAGFLFLLALGKPDGIHVAQRPAGLVLSRSDAGPVKKLTFGWSQRPKSDYVSLTRTGQYDGDRPQDRTLKRTT